MPQLRGLPAAVLGIALWVVLEDAPAPHEGKYSVLDLVTGFLFSPRLAGQSDEILEGLSSWDVPVGIALF